MVQGHGLIESEEETVGMLDFDEVKRHRYVDVPKPVPNFMETCGT